MFRRFYYRPGWNNHFRWSNLKKYSTTAYIGFSLGGSISAYGLAMIIDVEKEAKRRRKWVENARNNFLNPNSNDSMRESHKTLFTLAGLNTVVFGAWKIPSLNRFMSKWFLHSIHSHPITMLTSIFSHKTPMHLVFNMLALWSFGQVLHDRLGREQFMAFYFTSGLSASLGSHFLKFWRTDSACSLGASGAVFGVAGACAHIPNTNVSLIFLPFHSVPLDKALPVIMAVDVIGIIRRWQSMDHAAHLSGALTGYSLYLASTRHIWPNRRKILANLGYPLK